MKEFAGDNFKFDKNGRKLSKWVENTVGKAEIACYKQFLLFLQCFQKACFPEASKGVIVWERVKFFTNWQDFKQVQIEGNCKRGTVYVCGSSVVTDLCLCKNIAEK